MADGEALKELVERLRKHVEIRRELRCSRLTLHRSLNEEWFSNTLAWLLNPNGSHDLEDKFLRALLLRAREVGRKQVGDRGRSWVPVHSTSQNASVVREFYLSRSFKKRGGEGGFCDVVVLDLDPGDGFMVFFENKLFGVGSRRQLGRYWEASNQKFAGLTARGYVYLTLFGEAPIPIEDVEHVGSREWVRLSWLEDVPRAIDAAVAESGGEAHEAVRSFQRLLAWLVRLADPAELPHKDREAARRAWLTGAATCLLARLEQLEGRLQRWKKPEIEKGHARLRRTGWPRTCVHVGLTSGLSASIQVLGSRGAVCDKILVPFGMEPEQALNLLWIAARQVCDVFGVATDSGMSAGVEGASLLVDAEYLPLFRLLHRHPFGLKVALLKGRHVDEVAGVEECALDGPNGAEG